MKIEATKTTKPHKHQVIAIWDERTLQEIKEKSLQNLTDNCEYQVHYWALDVQIVLKDDSSVTFHFPLVIYNYEQQVTSHSIDFNLSDVDKISDKLLSLAEYKAKEITQQYSFDKLFESPKKINYTLTNLNSLHRHP